MIDQQLFSHVYSALIDNDVNRKIKRVYAIYYGFRDGLYPDRTHQPVASLASPGRPEKPDLVDPRAVSRRRLGSKEGICAMLHAIAHIEFNAINLALDAAYRFQDMPDDFYQDWLRVAKEEAYHFSLITERLEALGSYYGAFNAHDGLWQACIDTEHDVMVRMALVPRVMEARGLDVTPGIQKKLRDHGETRSADLLEVIYRDEHGHVAIGSKWFKYCCAQRGLDYRKTFAALLQNYLKARVKGPFNIEARLQAGFDDLEMAMIESLAD